MCSDEATQTTVQIRGKAVEVTDPDERQAILNTMYRSSSEISRVELPPAEKLLAGEYKALKIIPSFIKMGIFARPDAQSNEELYETLEFA